MVLSAAITNNTVSSEVHEEVLNLTRELIRIPSTHSRREEINRCADFICDWLTAEGIRHERHESNNYPSVTVLPEPGKAPILLLAHFDVVEEEDIVQFEPTMTNDRLYGRGTIDDKYAVALCLVLFKEHLKRIRQTGGDQSQLGFGLLLTGDEEVGGENCVGVLCKQIATEFFIALDGGNPDLIVSKEKGILQLRLDAQGKAAHGARPWLGENAFDILAEDYQALKELFSTATKDHWHKTMVISNVNAGNGSVNVVPDQATATLDIRYTDHDDLDELLAQITSSVRSKVTVQSRVPVFASLPSPLIERLASHWDNAVIGFEHGASDARFFSEIGIPGVICGPEGEMSQHTSNEHIVLPSLYQLYNRLNSFLLDAEFRGKSN